MPIEVEQKFRVADFDEIAARLEERGAKFAAAELQVDRYFNHPLRDFAHTDEALRIRQVGDNNYVTYKGPKLDQTTKTRREIEVAIAPGDQAAGQFGEILIALGFRPVAVVRKQRRKTSIEHSERPIEIVLDDVERVGTYIEFECLADESAVVSSKQAIASLAAELALLESENERKSYLELLLQRR